MMPFLEMRGLRKRFGTRAAVDGVDLAIARGETVALFGPSGCGKTTLLSLLAGLLRPDAGGVWCEGVDLGTLPPEARGFPMVFQDHRLFPHLSVAGNVGFGLRMRGVPRAQVHERVLQALADVGLAGFEDRSAAQLSGGQKQRVALARAAVLRPAVWLLDEPFSALDAHLRGEARALVKRLHATYGMTTLLVTHDTADVHALADRVVVLEAGRIVQVGTPHALATRPEHAVVARLFSDANLIAGRSIDGSPCAAGTLCLPLSAVRMRVAAQEDRERDRSEGSGPAADVRVEAQLVDLAFRASHVEALCVWAEAQVRVSLSHAEAAPLSLGSGMPVILSWRRGDATVFV